MAPFEHVLVPVDLSSRSRAVVLHALALAAASSARVTLLHVAPPLIDDVARERLDRELYRLVSDLASVASPPVRTTLRQGADVVREILSVAKAQGVDLIVLTRRHRGPVDRLLLESVGERVTREATCSVVAIEESADVPAAVSIGHLSDILCAVDFGETSARTLEAAVALAQASGARLMVQHVIDPWRWKNPLPASPEGMDAAQSALAATAYERLAALLARSLHPDVKADTLVSFGLVPNQIVGAASVIRADLIVMGAHSTRVLGRTFLGGHARDVLREGHSPVLLVRPRAAARAARAGERELVSSR